MIRRSRWALIELLVTIFLFFLLVVSLVSVIRRCSDMAKRVDERGLKGVVERIWEGKNG